MRNRLLLVLAVMVMAPALPAAAVASGSGQFSWSPSLSSFASASSEARADGAIPVITRLSLSVAEPGARLTLSGRGFGARRSTGCVLFGALMSTSYVRWSATTITCTVPAVPAGKLLVKVRTAKGTSQGRLFTVRMATGALMQLGTVSWMTTSSYDGLPISKSDILAYYTDTAANLAIVSANVDLEDADKGTLSVSALNPSTLRRVGDTRSISLAGWPRWGGFYAGPDGCFYVLVGRENPNEDDALDVVAVRRYDSSWNLLGTAYLQGGASQGVKGIVTPFTGGAHMVLVGNRLVVHMGRLIYAIEGVRHQVNLTFEVNVDTMTATTFEDLGSYAWCSHSFKQLVAMNGGSLVMIDHGDGSPRAIQMGVMADYPVQREVSWYNLFEFNGAIGDNFTGATVTGLVSGPSGIAVVGNSIRQPDAPNGSLGSVTERRNIYAVWADPATGEHTVRWLTDFAPQGASDALEPRIVQVGSDRYAVLFSLQSHGSYRMEYRLIDSAGTVLASTSFSGVFFCAISDPILIGGKVYWVGIEPHPMADRVPNHLFGIDVSDPATPSLLYPTAP
jgi:IPT/TIG domain